MTKTSSLFCMTAALLCLTIGNAIAEDNTETQQAKPDVTNNQENQTKPKPKEEAGSNNPSKSNATQAEPDCN